MQSAAVIRGGDHAVPIAADATGGGDAVADVAVGARDRRDVLGPVVEAALSARVTVRADKAFGASDAIRDTLTATSIEVRDTPVGVEWSVPDPSDDGSRSFVVHLLVAEGAWLGAGGNLHSPRAPI